VDSTHCQEKAKTISYLPSFHPMKKPYPERETSVLFLSPWKSFPWFPYLTPAISPSGTSAAIPLFPPNTPSPPPTTPNPQKLRDPLPAPEGHLESRFFFLLTYGLSSLRETSPPLNRKGQKAQGSPGTPPLPSLQSPFPFIFLPLCPTSHSSPPPPPPPPPSPYACPNPPPHPPLTLSSHHLHPPRSLLKYSFPSPFNTPPPLSNLLSILPIMPNWFDS